VYRSQKLARSGYGNPFEVRDALSGALDIRAVSLSRQPKSVNHCAQDNGGCTHLCLNRNVDYVCACPDVMDPKDVACSIKPKVLVHANLENDQLLEYSDESTDDSTPPELLGESNDHGDDGHTKKSDQEREFFVLVALGVVIVMVVIIILVIFSKKMLLFERDKEISGAMECYESTSRDFYNLHNVLHLVSILIFISYTYQCLLSTRARRKTNAIPAAPVDLY